MRWYAGEGALDEDRGQLASADLAFGPAQGSGELLQLPPALLPEWNEPLYAPLRIGRSAPARTQPPADFGAELKQIERPAARQPGRGHDSRRSKGTPNAGSEILLSVLHGRTP